ncbi:MAG: hypothetical protein GX621_17375 [Pirellulaceae bacterium]|nr:hypothetical protein [Pirellulaceae bacterium]
MNDPRQAMPRVEPIVTSDHRRIGRRPERLPEGVYRADPGRVATARWLAAFLGVLVVVGALPAMGHLNPATAPGWARFLVLIALIQLAYLAWMATLPDWASVRVVMVVFASVAVLCLFVLAATVVTPADTVLPLGLETVRDKVARWCLAVLSLNLLGVFLCGRTSFGWQRFCRRFG